MKAISAYKLNTAKKTPKQGRGLDRRAFNGNVLRVLGLCLVGGAVAPPLRAGTRVLYKPMIPPNPIKYEIDGSDLKRFDHNSFYGRVKEVRDRYWWRFCWAERKDPLLPRSDNLYFTTAQGNLVLTLSVIGSVKLGSFLERNFRRDSSGNNDSPSFTQRNPGLLGGFSGGLITTSGLTYLSTKHNWEFTQRQYYEVNAPGSWRLYQQMGELQNLVDEITEARDLKKQLYEGSMKESRNSYLTKLANLPHSEAEKAIKPFRDALEQSIFSALVLLAQRAGELPAARMPTQSDIDGMQGYIKTLRTSTWQAQQQLNLALFQFN